MHDSYSRSASTLFDVLDLNRDGNLSRKELHTAALKLGWHWHEAPILALLDLLALREPIPRKKFTAIMHQVQKDPMGPYGDVLLNTPHFSKKSPERAERLRPRRPPLAGRISNPKSRPNLDGALGKGLVAALEKELNLNAAAGYQRLLDTLDTCQISVDDAALLIRELKRW